MRRVEIEALARRGALVDARQTLSQYCELWLSRLNSRLQETTIESYSNSLSKLGSLGNVVVVDVRRPHIKAWAQTLQDLGLARSTIATHLAALQQLLQEAVEDELLAANPAARIGRTLRLPNRLNKEPVEALTADQLSKLLSTAKERLPAAYPCLYLLSHTGLRIGEALGLLWSDLDLDRLTLNVERQIRPKGKVTAPKTLKGTRTVDLSDGLVLALRSLRVRQKERAMAEGYEVGPWVLFPEYVEGCPTMRQRAIIRRWLHRALALAGLPGHFHPHSLRHTFACIHLAEAMRLGKDSSVTIKYVSDQLGHAAIQETIDIYARSIRLSDHSAANAFDERVQRRAQMDLFRR